MDLRGDGTTLHVEYSGGSMNRHVTEVHRTKCTCTQMSASKTGEI